MADVKALAENLVGLTVKEVQELAEFLKTDYQTNLILIINAPKQSLKEQKELEDEDKDKLVEVYLEDAGPNKLAVVKLIKDFTGLGLKEAKDLVDGAPKLIDKKLRKEDALRLVTTLRYVDARGRVIL